MTELHTFSSNFSNKVFMNCVFNKVSLRFPTSPKTSSNNYFEILLLISVYKKTKKDEGNIKNIFEKIEKSNEICRKIKEILKNKSFSLRFLVFIKKDTSF